MMPESILLIFVGFIVLALVIRLMAGSLDGDRVRAYVENRLGGELIDQSWDPLGPGWFGEKDSRIYQIIYKDRSGRTHRASVKTSMMSGVYLTNDIVITEPKRQRTVVDRDDLEDEQLRLEARLREIKALRGSKKTREPS